MLKTINTTIPLTQFSHWKYTKKQPVLPSAYSVGKDCLGGLAVLSMIFRSLGISLNKRNLFFYFIEVLCKNKRLYNELCRLFAPIRIISVVSIKRSYWLSLVLFFNTLANGKGCFKVLFHTIFVNVYHHLLWCCYSAHVVQVLSTYGAEG